MLSAELKKNALQKISENAPKLFFISTLYVAIIAILGDLRLRLPGVVDAWEQFQVRLSAGELPAVGMLVSNFRTAGLAFAVAIMIAAPVLNAGFMSYCLKINRNHETDYIDIFEGFTLFFKIIFISVIVSAIVFLWLLPLIIPGIVAAYIYRLVYYILLDSPENIIFISVIVSAIVFICSLLLIIPGIVAAYRYRLVYYILLDSPEKNAIQCIRESALLMSGNKMELFLLDISFLGWILLNSIVMLVFFVVSPVALPLISLFLTPYRGLARAAFYDRAVRAAVI